MGSVLPWGHAGGPRPQASEERGGFVFDGRAYHVVLAFKPVPAAFAA